MRYSWKRSVIFGGLILFGIFCFFYSLQNKKNPTTEKVFPKTFPIVIIHDGLALPVKAHYGETVSMLLARLNLPLKKEDIVEPNENQLLSPRETVSILTARQYTIHFGDATYDGTTTLQTIRETIDSIGLILDPDDIVFPERESSLTNALDITLIAVDIYEESIQKSIPFTTEEREDDTLSWRKRLVKQAGKNGVRTLTYRVVDHDKKEIKRTLLSDKITIESLPEIVLQGTLVKVGKTHTGFGTWYAHTGTLAAASPWLPLGSFARVTNKENGKSVIVKINDRGPFGANRIIDLDRVAFEKIASLGAGVISVKVEEITN